MERMQGLQWLSGQEHAALAAAFLFTLACTIQDVRTRKIHILTFVIGALAGLGFCRSTGRGPGEILTAMLPGMAFLAMSRLRKDSIGAGDIVYVFVCGLYMDIQKLMMLLICAAALSAGTALVVLVRNYPTHTNMRTQTWPYMAFAAPAFLGLLVLL